MEAQVNRERAASPAALRPHDFGRLRGDRRGFRVQSVLLRIPLAASVIWSPMVAIRRLFPLGGVVLVSRLLFPKAQPPKLGQVRGEPVAANEQAGTGEGRLKVAARFGAGFEQVEQGAVLQQQLLTAKSQRTLACRSFGARSIDHRRSTLHREATAPGIRARRGRQHDRADGGSATSRQPEPSPRQARSLSVPKWPGSPAHDARPPGWTSVSAAPGVLGSGPTAEVRRTR